MNVIESRISLRLLFLTLTMTLTMTSAVFAQGVSSPITGSKTLKPPTPAPLIMVEPNVQASKAFPESPHNEIHLAANPRNPLNLVGGAMVHDPIKNKMKVIGYTSFDGGKSWTPTLTVDDSYFHSDPSIGFGPDGTAFFMQITNTGVPEPKYFTHVYRSLDGGKTWLPPTILPMYDRHYIAFDESSADRKNWVYINGSAASGVGFGRSKDGGKTFEEKRMAAKPPTGSRSTGLAPLQTLSDGKIVIPFFWIANEGIRDVEGPPAKAYATVKAVVSEDGGESFLEPVTIAEAGMGHMMRSNPNHFDSAVDQSEGPFKDRIYVVWSDSYNAGGSGVTAKKVNGSNILLSYSADGGKTWAKPIRVNDDTTDEAAYAAVHFQGAVAVNRDGVVGVTWHDRRDSANGIDYTPRFTASLDGGNTFLPSVKVSEAPFAFGNYRKQVFGARPYGGGQRPQNRNFWGGSLRFDFAISQFDLAGGHTTGLAADASGAFHPFWIDNRTGVSQIWTTAVRVNGKALPNGSADLAALDDLTEGVLLELRNQRFDVSSGRLLVDAIIENVSAETIKAPVKMRVVILDATSGGTPKIVNADNGLEGIGAIWDFSDRLVAGQLKPKEESKPKTIEFRVSNIPPITAQRLNDGGWRALQILHVEARLLGKVETRSATQK